MRYIQAQSQIISTVLLILLVLVAGLVIFSVVVPFVRNNLANSECFETINALSIKQGAYTCFSSSTAKMNVQVHVGDNTSISSFQIVVENMGSSSAFIIEEGKSTLGVTMYNGATSLVLPKQNEERTYTIAVTGKPDKISLYPVLNSGQSCDVADSLSIIGDC